MGLSEEGRLNREGRYLISINGNLKDKVGLDTEIGAYCNYRIGAP